MVSQTVVEVERASTPKGSTTPEGSPRKGEEMAKYCSELREYYKDKEKDVSDSKKKPV